MSRTGREPRPFRWLMLLPQLAVAALSVAAGVAIAGAEAGPLLGAGAYVLYSVVSRAILTRYHKRGMRLARAGQWDSAISSFRQGYDFLAAHPWIDRYRSIVLLSPSRASYREMALLNEAFCWMQLSRPSEAEALYERALALHPGSQTAREALGALRSGDSVEPSRGASA